jgi:hypothetical protein
METATRHRRRLPVVFSGRARRHFEREDERRSALNHEKRVPRLGTRTDCGEQREEFGSWADG